MTQGQFFRDAWTRGGGAAGLVSGSMRLGSTVRWDGSEKRYPRLGTVSIYRGFSASSPSASRSLRTATRRPLSKSTKVFSSQMRFWICSRLTTWPAFSRRITSRRNGCSCRLDPAPVLQEFTRYGVRFEGTEFVSRANRRFHASSSFAGGITAPVYATLCSSLLSTSCQLTKNSR